MTAPAPNINAYLEQVLRRNNPHAHTKRIHRAYIINIVVSRALCAWKTNERIGSKDNNIRSTSKTSRTKRKVDRRGAVITVF
ncbi:hypothetical protein SERLADRAFT_480274 [Serpula lacrymans var. lacrymans S7.9]|uniref:Uncharacterized protein n=1 Tax=Serpula lacrymans var. lacrymans (strain S7.9) TaxID=578457 RepID=F8PCY7_SERL9|nr:uncharacterized protein SERLADRAFT_480274 [Serpula lacrymans var. lacrymans S7.9]EGO19086.1 hypothetical protein SERLADRAFT_480274 [Serpula lacrymans var. lacrymans S7.9]